MCGFSGFLTSRKYNKSYYTDTLVHMGTVIENRGPDAYGVWSDELNGIGLSHRRLSILDLSEAGHQPMHSYSGRYTIAFNGEIYNHLNIRSEIDLLNNTTTWKSTSDTETLLTAIEIWGLKITLQKCRGMFALALWDNEKKVLLLARDRAGEKPLYYGFQNGELLFGSQLKSLKVHPSFNATISKESTVQFLKYGFIAAPLSIYNDIYKLFPGQIITVSAETFELTFDTYWDFETEVIKAKANPFQGSFGDASKELERLIIESVQQQMISDVPLGAFLSGGVDSSTIVGVMQSISNQKVKTFSIGFDEKGFNEAIYAKAVCEYLDTDHHELYLTGNDALKIVPNLSDYFDEPFSDSSQIPTYILASITKKEVTVALSGDAGDELFCGYNRYLSTNKYWSNLSKLPMGMRIFLENAYHKIPNNKLEDLFSNKLSFLNANTLVAKLNKVSTVLSSKDLNELYFRLLSKYLHPEDVLLNSEFVDGNISIKLPEVSLSGLEEMMYLDFKSYLVDDILVKVDRSSMAVSLETRVPFLDQEIIEFAWSLPLEYKLDRNKGKLVLRDVLSRYVPNELIERPKTGFGIPLDKWLRGPLVDWVESYLNKDFLDRQKIFNSNRVLNMWQEHKSGKRNWANALWNILMFQAWYYKNIETS